MNASSLFDHSSHAQTTQPQTAVTLIQQPDQAPSLTSTNLVGSLYGSLFSALLMGIWVAFVFFHLGMRAARRQARYYDRAAVQRQQVQTLERIWQMSAKRKD
jgi:predicted lipid-binding transport protein (Tim44 family)